MAYYAVTSSTEELDPDCYIDTYSTLVRATDRAVEIARQDPNSTYYVLEVKAKPVFKAHVQATVTAEVIP